MNLKIFILIITILSFNSLIFSQNLAITSFGSGKGIVYDICFSKDSSRLAIAEGNNINIYDIKSQQILYSLSTGHAKQVLCIDISPDDFYLVSGGQDGLVLLWDLKTHEVIKKLDYHKGVVSSVKFSPNQKAIASGSSDNTVVLYDIESDKVLYRFTNHKKDVSTLAFNADGEILATAGQDKTIYLIDTKTGESIGKLKEHKNFIRAVKFSKDNSRLISCDDDSRFIVWKTENIHDIKIVKNDKLQMDWLLSSDIYNDGKTFVAGSVNGKIMVISFFGKNKYDIGAPVQKVLFIPNHGATIKLAVATRGNGVLFIDTSK